MYWTYDLDNKKKFNIRETLNLLNDADSSTNIFVFAGVKKGADSIFFRSPVGRFSEEEEKNGLQDFNTGMLNQTLGLLNWTPKLDSSSGLLG